MSNNENWIDRAKEIWGPLAQAAIWIMGIISGFLLPPPEGIEDDRVWLTFAKFIVAICVGLLFLPSRLWRGRRHAKWWWLTAACCLALTIMSFIVYQKLTYASTCVTVKGVRVVIGSAYTDHGAEYLRDNPGISCTDLIDQHVGKIDDVWTKASIDRVRLKLSATYVACVPLIALCIMTIIQAIYCVTRD
jgi:hypothetical protein